MNFQLFWEGEESDFAVLLLNIYFAKVLLLTQKICFYCASGVVSSAMANPTDVLKVRLQSGRTDFKEKSLLQAFVSIYNQEGIQGLWRVSLRIIIGYECSG